MAQAGDNIVSSTDLYGGTWALFAHTLKQFGIETRFVDPADPENFRRATDDKTRAYYAETLPNPKLQVFPIREVADIGRELGVPLIVDNTAAPLIARPLEHGAAIVVYSATKYIGGHGTSIGGVIVDGGNFPWEQHAARFPLLTAAGPGLQRRHLARGRQTARPDRLPAAGAGEAAARHRRRRSRRSTPSSFCRGSRRCRCGCASTTRTPPRWRISCRATRTSSR